MKIAWIHSHLLIPTGGTKFIYEVTRRIASRGDLTLYCELADGNIKAMFERGGVPVKTIAKCTSTSAFYWLRLEQHLKDELNVLRRQVDPQSAVVSSMFPMNVLANGLTDRAVQYCFEPFAFFFSESMIGRLNWGKRLFCRYLKRRYGHLDIASTRKSKCVVTLNQITQRQIKKVYGIDSEITLAGVDTDFFCPKDTPVITARYAGEKIIMHSTDYSPVKASDLVVRAMPAILKAIPNARLLISNTLDDRSGRANLAALGRKLGVDKRITFLGRLEFSDVPKYYTLADVVIQPAFAVDAGTASMNLAVKEALACQTPVVRADITDEDAEHEVSGLLVPPNDPAAIATAAVSILSDSKRATQMGVMGRRKITELYNWDWTAEIIYRQILKANSRKNADE